MYRDDHEAALARLEAAEAELTRERSKDVKQEQRLTELERELAAAQAKLRETEEELAKHRPPPKPAEPKNAKNAEDGTWGPPALKIMGGVGVVALLALLANGTSEKRSSEWSVRVDDRAPVFVADEISELLPELRARGERTLMSSRMIELRGKGISSEGRLHEQYGEVQATFYRTDDMPEPVVDPKLPVGAAPPVQRSPFDRHKCIYVVRTATEWQDSRLGDITLCPMGDLYERRAALEPRCSMRAIWNRAILDGAPADAIADIALEQSTWRFEINDQRLQFSRTYADDCQR